ncbi:MAG: DUF934 domain-containing protein [Pseudomonadota bacterium]
MPIISEKGLSPEEPQRYIPAADVGESGDSYLAVALSNDEDPESLAPHFDRIALIAVPFPSFADGRGFSIAKRLRDLGYAGHLRATGHLIVDQFVMARRVGFDDVEISDALAERQPEALWLAAIQNASYRAKLRDPAPV